jgi:hypothetical protein
MSDVRVGHGMEGITMGISKIEHHWLHPLLAC